MPLYKKCSDFSEFNCSCRTFLCRSNSHRSKAGCLRILVNKRNGFARFRSHDPTKTLSCFDVSCFGDNFLVVSGFCFLCVEMCYAPMQEDITQRAKHIIIFLVTCRISNMGRESSTEWFCNPVSKTNMKTLIFGVLNARDMESPGCGHGFVARDPSTNNFEKRPAGCHACKF